MKVTRLDQFIRRFFPSSAKLSYNPLFKTAGYVVDFLPNLFFGKYFKHLPPNHLRVRIGVGNQIFLNQVRHLSHGKRFWLTSFSDGLCNLRSKIVDIGCGCGRIAQHLQDIEFTGVYTGIDLDKEIITYCRKQFKEPHFVFHLSPHKSTIYSAGNEVPAESAFYTLPIESETQDFVNSGSLFTHLLEKELQNYLLEAFRVLKKGGYMQMSVFCLESLAETGSLGGRWTFQHKIGNASLESLEFPEAAVAYSKDFLTDSARAVGFSEVALITRPGQSWLRCQK